MDPQRYCAEQAAAPGSSLYYSLRFVPAAPRRAAAQALLAFCREMRGVTRNCTDVGVARTKLDWWRQEVERLFKNQPQHPITQALHTHLPHYHLPAEHFLEIIDGWAMDLEHGHYESFKHLALYCHRVGGIPGLLSTEIFGYTARDSLDYGRELGVALQLTRVLRSLPQELRHGRMYIPLDELEAAGVQLQDLHHPLTPTPVRGLLEQQMQRARLHYDRALQRLPAPDRYAQVGGLILAVLNQTVLDEIRRDGYRILEHHIRLTPLRKLWLAWRTARRERRIRARHRPEPAQS